MNSIRNFARKYLIETMIVIAIIGVLAALILPHNVTAQGPQGGQGGMLAPGGLFWNSAAFTMNPSNANTQAATIQTNNLGKVHMFLNITPTNATSSVALKLLNVTTGQSYQLGSCAQTQLVTVTSSLGDQWVLIEGSGTSSTGAVGAVSGFNRY